MIRFAACLLVLTTCFCLHPAQAGDFECSAPAEPLTGELRGGDGSAGSATTNEALGVEGLVCPDGAQQEGEPPCQDEYRDEYNGGCCCAGPLAFTPILPDPQGMAIMCGKSCTFLFNGFSYRDSDWFILEAGGSVTATCTAEFPVLFMLMHETDCSELQYIYAMGDAYELLTLEWPFEPGAPFYLWVGPSAFSGVSESNYILEIAGLRGEPGAVGEAENGPLSGDGAKTWGSVKERFR